MSDVKRVMEVDMFVNENEEVECRIRLDKNIPQSIFLFLAKCVMKNIAEYIQERHWDNEKNETFIN